MEGCFTFQWGGGGLFFRWGGFIFKWGGASWGESVLMGGVFKKNVGWGGGGSPPLWETLAPVLLHQSNETR